MKGQLMDNVMETRRPSGGLRAAMAALGAVLVAGLTAASAGALPPDGPGPESPGTSSRVWPSEVVAGDLLYFEVSGYPANETVYIKIDDGTACTDTSHGACVYHTQKLDANGYASGSLVVPNLAVGDHWLRMLATGDVFDSVTGEKIGYQGYTRRGGNDFTVVAGSSTVAGGGGVNADGSIGSGSVVVGLGEATPAPSTSPSTDVDMDEITQKVDTQAEKAPDALSSPSPSPAVLAQEAAPGSSFPLVGVVVLGLAVLIAAGLLVWATLSRRRGRGEDAPSLT